MTLDAFADTLEDMMVETRKYHTCMSLRVSKDGKSVELLLDTSIATFSEWIPGEGADIGLLRCILTNKVVGCRLPLMNSRLAISHEGPLRINEGFLKEDDDSANV